MLPVVCTCEKRFPNLRQKLVDGKLITFLSDNEAKREFLRFISDVVRENKALFCNCYVKSFNLDGLYMECLKDASIISPSLKFLNFFDFISRSGRCLAWIQS